MRKSNKSIKCKRNSSDLLTNISLQFKLVLKRKPGVYGKYYYTTLPEKCVYTAMNKCNGKLIKQSSDAVLFRPETTNYMTAIVSKWKLIPRMVSS